MAKKLERDRVVQTGLRIRASLRDRLEAEAKRSGISLNSEIERRLEASFTSLAKANAQANAIEATLKRLTKALKEKGGVLDARQHSQTRSGLVGNPTRT